VHGELEIKCQSRNLELRTRVVPVNFIMEVKYNTRSPAVKRLMREAQELAEPTYDYFAQPLSDNLFEWHFTVRGPAETEFDGGIYHGRIVLPPDYPMKPPNIIVLTVIHDGNVSKCISRQAY